MVNKIDPVEPMVTDSEFAKYMVLVALVWIAIVVVSMIFIQPHSIRVHRGYKR